MEGIICEREMMLAENKQREVQGDVMVYGEQSFSYLRERLQHLSELAASER